MIFEEGESEKVNELAHKLYHFVLDNTTGDMRTDLIALAQTTNDLFNNVRHAIDNKTKKPSWIA